MGPLHSPPLRADWDYERGAPALKLKAGFPAEKTIEGMTIEEWAMEYKQFQKEVNKRLEAMGSESRTSDVAVNDLAQLKKCLEQIAIHNPDTPAAMRAQTTLNSIPWAFYGL